MRSAEASSRRLRLALLLATGLVANHGATCGARADEPVTEVTEALYSLQLPGRWHLERSSEEAEQRWVTDAGAEQVSIDVRLAPRPLDEAARDRLLARVVDARRKAEREAAGRDTLRLGQVTRSRRAGWRVAHYDGEVGTPARRFSCLAIVSASTVAVFYYEAVGLDDAAAQARRNAVFDSVALAEYDYD